MKGYDNFAFLRIFSKPAGFQKPDWFINRLPYCKIFLNSLKRVWFLVSLIFIGASPALLGQPQAINKADSLIALTQYESAGRYIEDQIGTAHDLKSKTLLLNKLAEVEILLGQLDKAEATLQGIANTGDVFTDAITLTNRGFFFLNKGRYDLASEHLQNALAKFQTAQQQDTREGAKCLSTLGLVYGSTRKYNQAEESHLVALQIRERLFGADSEEVAASNNDLGMIFLETNPDKALEYFDKAVATYRKIHGESHPKIAIVRTNMGFAYRKLDLLGDAINDFDEANKIWQRIYPDGHPNQALVLSFLGQTYRQMNDTKTSQSYFEKALAIYKKSYGDKHPDISKTLVESGLLQLSQSQYADALKSFQQSIIANAPDFNDTDFRKNPARADHYNNLGMLYSLRYKAQALESRYYGASLKLEDLLVALSTLHFCDSLIDDIRYQSTDVNDKIALGEIASEVYEDGVRIAHAISEMTLDFRKYRELAFYFAEKSKSAVLQESIADAQALSYSGIPDELLEEEKHLKASITLLVQKIAQKPSVEEEKYLREALFTLNREYNGFKKKLEKEYPNYFNLKFNQQTPSIAETQGALDDRTAVISYFIAERNNRIYQFIISHKRFVIRNLSLPTDFDRMVKGFNNSLYYSDFDTYKETAPRLGKVLVPPLPSAIERIIIIPSGRLGTVPFEAIPYANRKTGRFAGVEFLAKRYAVSYEFSSGLMLQKSNHKERSSDPRIFLCAPVEFNQNNFLPSLPASENEVSTIAALFKNSSTILTHTGASESSVKSSDLSKYNYLHFATHGVVDEVNPELSRIFLNGGGDDDGDLFAGEIYNLNMRSDLAVLSACQTGLGKLSKGEGVIGLSRALTYAGTKNIIVSYWRVADESTALLMTEFYRVLLHNNSLSFAEALRSAKLKLIQNPDYSAPYFWAPFVLIGR
jgi:CHAT domain-containing protein/Flp pilus assembly protein TadD